MNRNVTNAEVAVRIEDFLLGRGGRWDWDEFLSFPIANPMLEEIRVLCGSLPEIYPPTKKGHYCNDEGLRLLRDTVVKLRG
jgi:hypothetical protein